MAQQSNFTLQMLATLDAAIASGAKSVYYGDKRVEYNSLNDMMRVRNLMCIELGLSAPDYGRRLAVFDKGLTGCCVVLSKTGVDTYLPNSEKILIAGLGQDVYVDQFTYLPMTNRIVTYIMVNDIPNSAGFSKPLQSAVCKLTNGNVVKDGDTIVIFYQ